MRKFYSNIGTCKLKVEFLCYSDMKNYLIEIYKKYPESFTRALKNDYIDLTSIKLNLENCLNYCNKQISFIESFLDDCGVNIYDK